MRLLNRWVDAAAAGLFAATLVLVNVQILCRFVLAIGVPWTEEVSRLIFIWLAYIGAATPARAR
jgi:TRAP-type transport system small permease protein